MLKISVPDWLDYVSEQAGDEASLLSARVREQIENWEHDGALVLDVTRFVINKYDRASCATKDDPEEYDQMKMDMLGKIQLAIHTGQYARPAGHFAHEASNS